MATITTTIQNYVLKSARFTINRRFKTFTMVWIEDYANEETGKVNSKLKSETFSYSFLVNPGGLSTILSMLNVSQYKGATRPPKILPYRIIK